MLRSSSRLAIVAQVVLFWASAFCAGSLLAADAPPAVSASERRALFERIETIGRRGFLYEVTRPAVGDERARKLYLYGTIHVGREDTLPFNSKVMVALKTSTRLALEADPSDAADILRLALDLGRYADSDSLDRHVPPALVTRAITLAALHGLAAEQTVRFKPWLLANMLVAIDTVGAGLDPGMGSEMFLTGYAKGAQLPIVEIEGMEAQLKLLAGLSDAMQSAQLEEAVAELESGKSKAQSKELFALWTSGDAAGAEQLVAQLHRDAEAKPFERFFVDTLLDARNKSMADKAESTMERHGTTFFAVGTLHLFGQRGLLREFEARGYRVRDLQ